MSLLLRKKGVDLDHNRFLILQGEVEQIAQMKPKALNENDTGMLEFLEDIIGSSRFQTPIEVLKRTVGELDELRGEKLNRVKLVEKEKDELEEPRNKAIEYIRMENEVSIRGLSVCKIWAILKRLPSPSLDCGKEESPVPALHLHVRREVGRLREGEVRLRGGTQGGPGSRREGGRA